MAVQWTNEWGTVRVFDRVVAVVAGRAAASCYGLVGMAARSPLKDGIAGLFSRDHPERGVEVRTEDGELVVDLHVVVGYGTKISEVAHNVQQHVRYTLQERLGLDVDRVNVYVDDVRIAEGEGDSNIGRQDVVR
ncbi:MAG: hypothetical protein BLM47_01050 [Candidatus Reconcilbacillus cellulovorans]|uniref:Asp23/Gls24 family envelope stress response protein n=1 Tax=Candidatus Reconcilbacillus cellulovorans TaxID=1906605 RepID=A0A2A6E4Q6_9BACL|nr:MAG: hypothetical protein BLM47_01050 [Candidatus Reconcilbacillus cellulovorans]